MLGGGQASFEAFHPLLAGRNDRYADELVLGKRKHHVELGAPVEQRLGGKDVGPGGE